VALTSKMGVSPKGGKRPFQDTKETGKRAEDGIVECSDGRRVTEVHG